MPELDFVLVADGATTRPDNKIDVYGAGFDTIFASAVPVRHAQLSIVVRVLLTQHEASSPHRLELVLMGDDGPEIARAQADAEVVPEEVRRGVPAGDRLGIAAVLNIQGLVFPRYGRYHLAVVWDGNELRQPVRLKVAPLPPNQAAFGQAE